MGAARPARRLRPLRHGTARPAARGRPARRGAAGADGGRQHRGRAYPSNPPVKYTATSARQEPANTAPVPPGRPARTQHAAGVKAPRGGSGPARTVSVARRGVRTQDTSGARRGAAWRRRSTACAAGQGASVASRPAGPARHSHAPRPYHPSAGATRRRAVGAGRLHRAAASTRPLPTHATNRSGGVAPGKAPPALKAGTRRDPGLQARTSAATRRPSPRRSRPVLRPSRRGGRGCDA